MDLFSKKLIFRDYKFFVIKQEIILKKIIYQNLNFFFNKSLHYQNIIHDIFSKNISEIKKFLQNFSFKISNYFFNGKFY